MIEDINNWEKRVKFTLKILNILTYNLIEYIHFLAGYSGFNKTLE